MPGSRLRKHRYRISLKNALYLGYQLLIGKVVARDRLGHGRQRPEAPARVLERPVVADGDEVVETDVGVVAAAGQHHEFGLAEPASHA